MALEACSCELGALPAAALRAGASYGASKAKEFAREETGLDIPTSKKEVVCKGKKLLASEANKLKGDLLAKAGVPNISIPPLKDLTVEGVKDAVYAGAKPYLDKAIQAKTGLPITLPKKLTVKDLENMVGSFFPTDAIEALNLALGVGAQLAAGALTSVLAGTAIGSAIPGLGTVVGLAVGLAVAGIKGLFFKAPTHPEGRECKFGDPRVKGGHCPKPPVNLNAFQFFTWTSKEMQPLWDGLRKEQSTRDCGRGGAINCVRGLSFMRDTAFGMSLAAVDQMGLPAVDTALAEVSRAPTIKSLPAAGMMLGQGAITFVTGFRGAQPLSEELRPIYDAKNRLIAKLQQRRAVLQARIALATAGQVSPDILLREMQTAAIQVQNNPNADAIKWLAMLTGFFKKATRTHAAVLKQRAATTRAAEAAHESRIQTDPRAKEAQIRTNRALCSGGNQTACAELQRLERAPAPAAVEMAKRVPPSAPPHVKAAAKRVLHRVESKPAPAAVEMAKKVTRTAPPEVKEAAKRVLQNEQASKKTKVSASVIESTKMPEIFQLFG